MQDETKPWPIFERVYKRQNQLLRKGQMGDEEELEYDEDSASSAGSKGDDCPLGPPAPIATIGLDEEIALRDSSLVKGAFGVCAEKELSQQGVSKENSLERRSAEGTEAEPPKDRSDTCQEASEKDKEASSHKGSLHATLESNPSGVSQTTAKQSAIQTLAQENPADLSSDISPPKKCLEGPIKSKQNCAAGAQQIGIPSFELPCIEAATIPCTEPRTPKGDAPKDPSVLPTLELTQSSSHIMTSKEKKSAKGSRKFRHKKVSDEEREELVPLSIPRTICYSLRSAIGDGSTRQRNSHSLMDRRPLRPNGCHLVSFTM